MLSAAAAAVALFSWQLRAFGAAIAFFHASEFLLAAVYMRDQLSASCEDSTQHGLSGAAAWRRGSQHFTSHHHCRCRCRCPPHAHVHRAALLLSWPYVAAMSCGLAECLVEAALLPGLKQQLGSTFSYPGLALLLAGEGVRKTAMVRAWTRACDAAAAKGRTGGGDAGGAGTAAVQHASERTAW